ncbi:GIY-YIG nuclease family protein [Baaleninema sp.]|uniref:GIY-YIG nuclease family protein n=1 Tax=Baaleninema sp. TaxID=3101197 RepID=UPI003D0948A9
MTATTEIPTLASLPPNPFIDENGHIADGDVKGKVGAYAVFDDSETLQYIGYSRDIALSLRQHLVRRPHQCYSYKVQTIDRPSRAVLETMRQAWIEENGTTPPGNGEDESLWVNPIDVRPRLTEEERQEIDNAADELAKTKRLKKAARRLEEEVLAELSARGVAESLRFNPKLKENGLLDLK